MQRNTSSGSESTTNPKVQKIAQAALDLEVSPRTIWRLLATGQLKKVQIGRAVRVTRASIDRFISEGGAR